MTDHLNLDIKGVARAAHEYSLMDGHTLDFTALPKHGLDYPLSQTTVLAEDRDNLPFGSKIDHHSEDVRLLFDAVERSDVFKAEHYITERKVDVNTRDKRDGSTALHIAAQRGPVEMINFLVKEGAHVDARDSQGFTPLHSAARNGKALELEALLKMKANPNVKNGYGGTALHMAAVDSSHHLSLKCAALLAKHGADLNIQRRDGSTALHLATHNRNVEVAAFLAESGADVTLKTNVGETPLHYAAARGLFSLVQLLVAKGAAVNAKDDNGSTPTHLAAGEGRSDVLQFLFFNGAEFSYDHSRKTQLDVAAQYDHQELVDWLRSFARHRKMQRMKETEAAASATAASKGGMQQQNSSSSSSVTSASGGGRLTPPPLSHEQLNQRSRPHTPEEHQSPHQKEPKKSCLHCVELAEERDEILAAYKKERAQWQKKVSFLKEEMEKMEKDKVREVERLKELLQGAEAARKFEGNMYKNEVAALKKKLGEV